MVAAHRVLTLPFRFLCVSSLPSFVPSFLPSFLRSFFPSSLLPPSLLASYTAEYNELCGAELVFINQHPRMLAGATLAGDFLAD